MMKVCYSEMDTPAGLSCRLEAAGHAGYAPAGQDIVCAGASTVMQGLVYLLAGEENAHSEAFDEPDGPRLAVSVDAPCEEWVRGAFELAKACFALMAERYPENIRFADVSRRGKESMMDLQLFAAEATAACGGNREPRLGQRSDFSKPCQGAAEKSANATRTGASRQIPSRFPTPRNVYQERCRQTHSSQVFLFWWTVQDENRDKQRQGTTMRAISCLLIFLTRRGILGSVQQIGISGGVFMPQMNKGGKFIFGKSLIRTDGTLRIPPQAMEEYHIADEGKVYLFTGSKITGGFCVTRKGLLHPSKLGHILDDTPPLLDYSAGSGEFIKYKGRSYCWVEISQEGQILLTKKMMDFLKVRPGMELLSIRSSDIAFTMGAKGPLLEKAENYDGEIPLF